MSYIGQAALKNSELKRFDVTSSTSATHALSWTAPNEQSLWITINGVKQQDDAYSIAGSPTTITLTDALVATDKMEVIGVLDIGVITTPGDNTVSTATLGDNAVTSAKIADGTIATADIADDAVTADKLANAINTSIAANTAKVTNATHTGDVTGATALTIAADAVDIAMLSATGTADATTFLRGDNAWASAGGTNTPAFHAYMYISPAIVQAVPDYVTTVIQFNTEVFDTDSAFDVTTHRFTPGVAGKYFLYTFMTIERIQMYRANVALRKNGTAFATDTMAWYIDGAQSTQKYDGLIMYGSVEANDTDYFDVTVWGDSTDGGDLNVYAQDITQSTSYFGGYRLII